MQSVRRVVNWVNKNIPEKTASILDLGCGNGVMLLELVCLYEPTLPYSLLGTV